MRPADEVVDEIIENLPELNHDTYIGYGSRFCEEDCEACAFEVWLAQLRAQL